MKILVDFKKRFTFTNRPKKAGLGLG